MKKNPFRIGPCYGEEKDHQFKTIYSYNKPLGMKNGFFHMLNGISTDIWYGFDTSELIDIRNAIEKYLDTEQSIKNSLHIVKSEPEDFDDGEVFYEIWFHETPLEGLKDVVGRRFTLQELTPLYQDLSNLVGEEDEG